MSRKEIQTIILLSLGAVIIWILTACEKKGNVNDDYLNLCKQTIESQGIDRWLGDYAYEEYLQRFHKIESTIEVTNFQKIDISLEELEKMHYDYVARVSPNSVVSADKPDEVIKNMRNAYMPFGESNKKYKIQTIYEYVSADVSYTAVVKREGEPYEERRFYWTCYFNIAHYISNYSLRRVCVIVYCLPKGSTHIKYRYFYIP